MTGRLRIGEILVEWGVLNHRQVAEVLAMQKRERLPFGVLAEQLFHVDAQTIQKAWLRQYHQQCAASVECASDTPTIGHEVEESIHRMATHAA